MSVYRIYAEKKPEYAMEANSVLTDIVTSLRLPVTQVRILHRYDVDSCSKADFERAIMGVFSEPQVDVVYDELPPLEAGQRRFTIAYLPGQFDQRADSCEQCMQILLGGERPRVRTADVYLITGALTDAQFDRLRAYLINPVERYEVGDELPETLEMQVEIPTSVKVLTGFTDLDSDGLANFVAQYGLAMDTADIAFCQAYFRDTEKRDPTITEIRMIDTYWSDHCRHTTFLTHLDEVTIDTPYIQQTYDDYLHVRETLSRADKPLTLLDLATIAAKKLREDGLLDALDESEEINACTIRIDVDIDGDVSPWVLCFKNETHNHPTEIEPFGGAATCLGGAIRDPLAGRTYNYQAMRVTGASNPLVPVEDTIVGKLPQRKICVGAANGYSSYGNQIGLATGHVSEIYHHGYLAKRMEIGAVLGAAPAKNIRRERPATGDIIILLGGKTGRDGCGGATGSSKSHTLSSLESCGAEVQKGNPPEERKLQRLFRDPKVTLMIKRCNDFGAGGVSVAIGELADGIDIDLGAVPKKYAGLDGTEIAISESQERLAVVVAREDADKFIAAAAKENLEATAVAVVTDTARLRMYWNDVAIVDLSREFLNSNGATRSASAHIVAPEGPAPVMLEDSRDAWCETLSHLNICSQKGLVERFDSTIGAGTILMPYGGIYQLSPSQAMAAKIPVLKGETDTCTLMAWGHHPDIATRNPYLGAIDAVITSIAKVVAAGGSYHACYLTFQEYFERMTDDSTRWGKPLASLLGAFRAQLELRCGSIGGKDSMSGTFEDIDVPPTLVSFAVSTAKAQTIVSTDFKKAGDNVIMLCPDVDENGIPCFESVRAIFDKVEAMIAKGRVLAAWVIDFGGVAEGIAKMGFGSAIGFRFARQLSDDVLFAPCSGGFLLEIKGDAEEGEDVIGQTCAEREIACPQFTLSLEELLGVWSHKLEPIFPCTVDTPNEAVKPINYTRHTDLSPLIHTPQPRVLIPVFPGTNCEYDTARVFERAGARPEIFVIRNQSADDMAQSVQMFAKMVRNVQIIMIPGGFSGGDEPEGSGKFITAFFRSPRVMAAVNELLQYRDGLMLGICNGFQALIKLGLVPFGEIMPMTEVSPTLTYNTIDRHQSMLVRTRIASNKSPWLYGVEVGDIHAVAISHGEGRFVAPVALIEDLEKNGQIATQYVDPAGTPSMDIRWNPNGSMCAIEGITSPDGRVLGKMGHSERIGRGLYKNVPLETDQKIFESGVAYFK